MPTRHRFRWIEGAEHYHFTFDEETILVEEVPAVTFEKRLSREELDGLMRRYRKNPEHFVGKSAAVFLEYLTKRGIELPPA